jgi:LacI family transcriptional regulator
MAARKVGINTVAERAGVSIATVSRVMSGSTSVNPAMAERVRAAATELGYRPNGAARGLASGQNRSVGVLMPDMANPYCAQVMRAVSRQTNEHEFAMVVADSGGDAGNELSRCEELISHVDGLVLLAPRMPAADLRTLAARDFPAVVVDRIELGADIPMVGVDSFSATSEMCQHLVSLGHRRAVYLSGPRASWQCSERRRAVVQARSLGLEMTAVETAGDMQAGHDAVAEALACRATAVIAYNDLVAVGAMAALREHGLDVPGAVSVTGFDDAIVGRFSHPPLTTARSPMDDLGKLAWKLLWSAMRGDRPTPPDLLSAAVIYRASTGSAPAGASAAQ